MSSEHGDSHSEQCDDKSQEEEMVVDIPPIITNHCYCCTTELVQDMIKCNECNRFFHIICLKAGRLSPLEGDLFFHFKCAMCSPVGQEEAARMKLQWQLVVMLTLYNLQLQGNGKCGYFRWREHICTFIDKYWTTFFGFSKKKTQTWHGTIAGTLSSGCPEHFKSGSHELKESGWWTLSHPRPPTLEMAENAANKPSKRSRSEIKETLIKVEGLRNRHSKTAIQAAIELKEKRSATREAKEIRKAKAVAMRNSFDSISPIKQEPIDPISSQSLPATIKQEPDDSGVSQESIDPGFPQEFSSVIKQEEESCSSLSVFDLMPASERSQDSWFTEKDLRPGETVPQLLLKEDDALDVYIDDIEINPSNSPPPQPDALQIEDIMEALKTKPNEVTYSSIKHDVSEDTADTINLSRSSDSDESDDESDGESDSDRNPVRRRRLNQQPEEDSQPAKEPEIKCVPMNVYEENQLLHQLNITPDILEKCPEAQRLRRKLILRQIKRERSLPLFDLDSEMQNLYGLTDYMCSFKDSNAFYDCPDVPAMRYTGYYRVLDRFQMSPYSVRASQQQMASFLMRLVGSDEMQLQSICSPYTSRVLKPFIRRDFETFPLKLKLLQEIIAYSHRNDSNWKAPSCNSIDYCYVQAQHIPSVNALCREFFWPGIDLSECLNYPDFSVVSLYKKVVIGFGFMVPDVKYNEAYISFIFTHPEWRNAGIGTFMLYHLIQTCMGKDVTLHVSATNNAMLLYQKFGFKPEEFILDFYDKYYPADSKDCKHAVFLRLRR